MDGFLSISHFLAQNWTYLQFPWMDFDEKYFFGNVMSYTLSYKNLESKISPISLLNLDPKLKFAENRPGTRGILE
jgi:hypothetical protein